KDEFGRVSSIEWQFQHPLVVDHLTDPRASRFDQSGIRFHLDLLGHLADLQGYRDHRIRPDLQYDSGLQISPEPWKTGLQHVWPDRQVGQCVRPGLITDDCSLGAGCCLRHINFYAWQNSSALI